MSRRKARFEWGIQASTNLVIRFTVDEWKMPAFMGLTTWAAFTEGKGAEAMVMGDFALLQDEVNPVMSALLEAGLSVTALHNHFFFDEPNRSRIVIISAIA